MTIEKDLKTLTEAVVNIANSLLDITEIMKINSSEALAAPIHIPSNEIPQNLRVQSVPSLLPETLPEIITIESLNSLAMQVNEMKGGDGKFIMSILARFNVNSISTLSTEHYEQFKTILDTA